MRYFLEREDMKAWKWALMATILVLVTAAGAWEASAGDLVEDPNSRGTVWNIKAGETVYLARNRNVTLMLTVDASQATAKAQKSGRMYQDPDQKPHL